MRGTEQLYKHTPEKLNPIISQYCREQEIIQLITRKQKEIES
jgi:hypothetical protein